MGYSVKEHLEYNIWANRLIAEMIQPLDEEIINREIKNSFPSVFRTLLHLWDSQVIWLSRLKGDISFTRPSESFKGSKYDLLAGLISSAEIINSFIDSKGPDFLSKKIAYKNLKGVPQEDGVAEILNHIVNHGTYHRGQLVTMLRELGVTEIVNTDLIRFVREH